MRMNVHNSMLRFRANDALITSAEAKARRDGVSLSELLRRALRNAVKDA